MLNDLDIKDIRDLYLFVKQETHVVYEDSSAIQVTVAKSCLEVAQKSSVPELDPTGTLSSAAAAGPTADKPAAASLGGDGQGQPPPPSTAEYHLSVDSSGAAPGQGPAAADSSTPPGGAVSALAGTAKVPSGLSGAERSAASPDHSLVKPGRLHESQL